jgi:hypothetical protein
MCNPVPRYHPVFFFWHHQWCVVILSASTIFCEENAVNTSSLIRLQVGLVFCCNSVQKRGFMTMTA